MDEQFRLGWLAARSAAVRLIQQNEEWVHPASSRRVIMSRRQESLAGLAYADAILAMELPEEPTNTAAQDASSG